MENINSNNNMKIEEILENWFMKNCDKDTDYKEIITNNARILKEAFIAGYNQAIEDRKKIEGGSFLV
jgi:hypothetical protein